MTESPKEAIAEGLCQYLEWDSQFFGVRIARAAPHKLTPASLESILHWCNRNSIDCLYFLSSASDQITVGLLQKYAFQFVDIQMKMGIHLPAAYTRSPAAAVVIRHALPSDMAALKRIARVSHRDSRFYFDGHFPSSRCDALYETWIERSCGDYADAVLVVECQNLPMGYISCHLKDDMGMRRGEIGLFALDEAARGKGLGSELVTASLDWFSQQLVERVSVITQGRNTPAQRLYQRCKFVSDSVHLWYHKWFESAAKE